MREKQAGAGSGSFEDTGPFQIVAMEKEAQTYGMHESRLGKRESLAHKTTKELPQGALIPTNEVRGRKNKERAQKPSGRSAQPCISESKQGRASASRITCLDHEWDLR